MSRVKSCCETVFVSQLSRDYPRRGGYFLREALKPSLRVRESDNSGCILRDNLGEGNCESKIAARQWIKMSRKALWVVFFERFPSFEDF